MSIFHTAPKDQLVADLKKVMSDVDELMRSVGSQAGGELHDQLGARLKDVRRQVQQLEHDLVEQARAAARATDGYMREHPWTSVGVAACVGMVIGALLARR